MDSKTRFDSLLDVDLNPQGSKPFNTNKYFYNLIHLVQFILSRHNLYKAIWLL